MPKIKPFVDFTWWLNANTTNAVGDKDLIKATNVFYNAAWQLQTRRWYRKFANQIGSSPITSFFSFRNTNTGEQVTVCSSWTQMYKLLSWSWTSIATGLQEYETLPRLSGQRTRRDYVVYKNTIYMCDWVNLYCSFDWTTFNKIGVWTALSPVTVDSATDTFTHTWHWLAVGDEIFFTTSWTMPWWVNSWQVYYVHSVPTSATFKITTSPTWSALDVTSNWSWTLAGYKVTEPRVRYLEISWWHARWAWYDKSPSTLYFTDWFSLPLNDLTNLNANVALIGKEQDWIINWLSEYNQGVIIAKTSKIHYWSRATGSFVESSIDSQTGGYADRAINTVSNSLVYFNERGIDSLAKRAWVDGAWALESQPLSSKIRDLINTLKPKNYNSSAWQYIKEVNNYHFVFDSNQDDIPDTMVVYSALTWWRTQYTFPNIYDFGQYIDSSNNIQYLFASASGGQMYEYEYWFDDDWSPIEVDIQTKKYDFGDPAQFKTFRFVDVIGRKQEWWEINLTVYVDDETQGEWTVTDSHIDISGGWLWISALWTETLWGEGSDLFLYPFTVRVPLSTYAIGSNISLRIQASWVQLIFEKMRVGVDAEVIDVFWYNNIL